MNEDKFRNEVIKILKEAFKEYEIVSSGNLIYKLMIGPNGEVQPSNVKDPNRGELAFQTDILIKNKKIPLVVAETKYGGFTTHDILTYSAKAIKHKEVYPYLRYGLIVGREDRIERRFFIHNIGFDFAIAVKNIEDNNEQEELVEIIRNQIKAANELSKVFSGTRRVKRYMTNLEFS